MTGVHLGGESDAEMEELLPKVGIEEGGLGELYDGSSVVGGGGGGDGATLEPSESLVIHL